MSLLARVLDQARSTLAELRDQAGAAARTATEIAEKMREPGDRLAAMAAEEADLARRLEALRGDMVAVRQSWDELNAERLHYVGAAEAHAAMADHYERTTIPEAERLLAAPPAPIEQAPAGPVPPPRDETALVPAPDDLPFNVVDSSGAEWLTGGNPIVTATDVAEHVPGPRHAARRTGALAVIGLVKRTPPTDDTPQEDA